MRFEFHPLRFELAAREPLFFPQGKAANILRGALGVIFRRIDPCLYAGVFQPSMANRASLNRSSLKGPAPSGLSDWPRPFVFRARHLDGRTIDAGEAFSFDLHVFSLDQNVIASLVSSFAALAEEGLGPRRGRADLVQVCTIPLDAAPGRAITREMMPASIDLDAGTGAPDRIRVDFLSPTELKHENEIAGRPEFHILFGRIRDRISTLRSLYGPGPLDIDFQKSSERSAGVRMTDCRIQRREAERLSTRTGQWHSIGGFVGTAEYEGDLAEFLPYLEAGRWTGVGRQAVWGNGEIAVSRR